jgi:DHA2 family multidrug resistance protein
MMRQLGGSFGIALITTFMASQHVVHYSALASKLDATNPVLQQRLTGMQHNFMSKGMSAEVALKSAYTSIDHMVSKQASILSYMDVFLYLGILFLICIPFVVLVRGNIKKKVDLAEAMH